MLNTTHTWPVRVYYEDTDHSGVVYHPNYLRFFERARTELLRQKSIHLDTLQSTEGIHFAVTRANISYHAPACFNEELNIRSHIAFLKRASLGFSQSLWRGNKTLANAEIFLACLDMNGKPSRIPQTVAKLLSPVAQAKE